MKLRNQPVPVLEGWTHTHSTNLSKSQMGLPNVLAPLQLEHLRTSMANAAHRGRDEPWSSLLPASVSVNLQNVTCICIRRYFVNVLLTYFVFVLVVLVLLDSPRY